MLTKRDTNTQTKEEEDIVRLNENPHLRIASEVALVLEENLKLVHPIIKRLFYKKLLPSLPLAGRLKHFHKNWELITRDPDILALIKGFKIPSFSQPVQDYVRRIPEMSKAQRELVKREMQTMLRKGAISQIDHTQGKLISSLFLVEKKDGGQRPVINLKSLNFFVPYEHFKMESLNSLQFFLKKVDYMAKLDLKDAYFCVTLHKESRKFVRFQWDGKLYEFLCLCFVLGPAPRIFTKLLKVSLAVLRRSNLLIIIYIDEMLKIGRTREEVESTRDTLIYLLQHLGFVLNLKKSVLHRCQEIELLGLMVNSVNLTLSLPLQKVQKVQEECTKMYSKNWTSILELTKLLGLLLSTIQAVVPARLQIQNLQQLQIQSLKLKKSFQINVKLTALAKEELLW